MYPQEGKKRVGRMERGAWKHALSYIKLDSRGTLLYDSRSSNPLLCWDGVGDEREVQEGGGICIPMVDSC